MLSTTLYFIINVTINFILLCRNSHLLVVIIVHNAKEVIWHQGQKECCPKNRCFSLSRVFSTSSLSRSWDSYIVLSSLGQGSQEGGWHECRRWVSVQQDQWNTSQNSPWPKEYSFWNRTAGELVYFSNERAKYSTDKQDGWSRGKSASSSFPG